MTYVTACGGERRIARTPPRAVQQAQRPRRAAAQDGGVAGDRAGAADRAQAAAAVLEVHAAERGDEVLQGAGVARVVLVEQRRVAVADVQAVRRAVAAHVADLLGVEVQPRAGALLDPPPDLVGVERAVGRPSSAPALPMYAAGWKENIRKPMSRVARSTAGISSMLRGVTVMLWAR